MKYSTLLQASIFKYFSEFYSNRKKKSVPEESSRTNVLIYRIRIIKHDSNLEWGEFFEREYRPLACSRVRLRVTNKRISRLKNHEVKSGVANGYQQIYLPAIFWIKLFLAAISRTLFLATLQPPNVSFSGRQVHPLCAFDDSPFDHFTINASIQRRWLMNAYPEWPHFLPLYRNALKCIFLRFLIFLLFFLFILANIYLYTFIRCYNRSWF